MTVNRFLALFLAALVGCASSEGGVVGSGISSVSGNVTLVQDEETTDGVAAGVLPIPVRVAIVEAAIEGDADADGNFELTGEFSGQVTLRFFDASTEGRLGDFSLEVPVGSTTILQNIEISRRTMTVRPEIVQQMDFLGRIEMAECEADGTGMLLVNEGASGNGRQFLVRLLAATELRRPDGQILLCQDLRPRDLVLLDGALLSDLTVAAFRLTVSPSQRPMPGAVIRPIDVRGRVTRINCSAGGMEVEDLRLDRPRRQQIRFAPETRFVCLDPDERACACEEVQPGNLVVVDGTIRVDRPGVIDAALVTASTGERPVSFVGDVLRTFCAEGIVQVERNDRNRVLLRLSPMTSVLCGDPPLSCGCEEIATGSVISVEGTVRVERPGVVDATRIRVRDG